MSQGPRDLHGLESRKEREERPLKVITIYFPELMLESLDEAVHRKLVPNRAEGVRLAVRDWLADQGLWEAPEPYEPEEIPGPEDGIRKYRWKSPTCPAH